VKIPNLFELGLRRLLGSAEELRCGGTVGIRSDWSAVGPLLGHIVRLVCRGPEFGPIDHFKMRINYGRGYGAMNGALNVEPRRVGTDLHRQGTLTHNIHCTRREHMGKFKMAEWAFSRISGLIWPYLG